MHVGGVFIATLFGLALAMVTLLGEVIYYKRKKVKETKSVTKNPQTIKTISVKPAIPESITFGTQFKPILDDENRLRVSHLTLYPKPRNRIN